MTGVDSPVSIEEMMLGISFACFAFVFETVPQAAQSGLELAIYSIVELELIFLPLPTQCQMLYYRHLKSYSLNIILAVNPKTALT